MEWTEGLAFILCTTIIPHNVVYSVYFYYCHNLGGYYIFFVGLSRYWVFVSLSFVIQFYFCLLYIFGPTMQKLLLLWCAPHYTTLKVAKLLQKSWTFQILCKSFCAFWVHGAKIRFSATSTMDSQTKRPKLVEYRSLLDVNNKFTHFSAFCACYRLQKSIQNDLMDYIANIKFCSNIHIS